MNCPNCQRANRSDARFCDNCGASLVARPVAAEPTVARKVVTIVFADLIGSTALHERLDAGPILIGAHAGEAPKRLYAALGFVPLCMTREYFAERTT